MCKFSEEISKTVPEWLVLEQSGSVASHTFNVLYLISIDPIFVQDLSYQQKNILLWAALLHDIKKRGKNDF